MSSGVWPVSEASVLPPVAKPRYVWIDAARGVGITLVVFGHAAGGLIAAGLIPSRGSLFTIFDLIYTFHMPLFFFVSGLLTPARIIRGRSEFLSSLVPTIVWPYFLWSAVQLSVILMASSVVNAPLPFASARMFVGLLWNPTGQFWFLYVLLIGHALAAVIAPKFGWLALLVISFCLYPLADPGFSKGVLNFTVHFLPFYALGALAGSANGLMESPRFLKQNRWGVLIAAVVVLGASLSLAERDDFGFWSPQMFAAGIAGTALVLTVVTMLPQRQLAAVAWLGKRAMPIYLLHVLFVAGLRILLDRILGLPIGAPALLLIVPFGIVGPLIVFAVAERLGLSRILGFGTLRRTPAAARG